MAASQSNYRHAPYRVGKWLPSDQKLLDAWLGEFVKTAHAEELPLHPVIQELKDVIEGDSAIFMLFHLMFSQVPHKPPYNLDPSGQSEVRSYLVMLQLLNRIMRSAPEYNSTVMVGCPINAILDWPMGTNAGFTAFLHPKVNAQFKKILDEWGKFLSSEDSCYVLNDDAETGWFGNHAMEAMPDFVRDFECDPSKPHHGFRSWDTFFTRAFRPGRRPVADPDDEKVIVNPCESAPYRVAQHVRLRERFWIKAQPYSLEDMLRDDPLTPRFVGGTVYQAFLSPLTYHRWHSPLNGKVVKTYKIDGTYFSENLAEGFDPAGPNESQGYITALATRALIFIEAENPAIGLVCFMAVGMVEVSSCEVTVSKGQQLKKGDQLGMFHFGGSTFCLLFGPHVKLEFDLHGETPGLHSSNIRLNERLATVL